MQKYLGSIFVYKCHIPQSSQFILCLFLTLDVCSSLFPTVHGVDSILSIESTITSIILEPWTCNDVNYEIFDISRFSLLESLEIGSNSFAFVKMFKIEDLSKLKSLKIGIRSFTKQKSSSGEDKSKSFHILNCTSLESIEIGEFSFSDFGGDFELKNLESLQSLKIGSINSESDSFFKSSFVVRGLI